MPLGLRWGTVSAVTERVQGLVRLEVDGDPCIAYPGLTGPVEEGERAIAPLRSLRTTFSQTAGCAATG